MFENITFETILHDMLGYVSSKDSSLDTRTGSIIYDSLAPISLELEDVFKKLDMVLNEFSLDTASLEYLVEWGKILGLAYREGTCQIYKGLCLYELAVGTTYTLNGVDYTVLGTIQNDTNFENHYALKIQCNTPGYIEFGGGFRLNLPKSAPTADDLKKAQLYYIDLYGVYEYGSDGEDVEEYRYRLKLHANSRANDGNVAQYREWLDEFVGDVIGKYHIQPCWNGVNTVRLSIIPKLGDDWYFTEETIKQIQDHFDPVADGETLDDDTTLETYPQGRGMGNGVAPIGSIVSVVDPEIVVFDIYCILHQNQRGISTDKVEEELLRKLDEFAYEITFRESKMDWGQIYNVIQSVHGVGYISDLRIVIGTPTESDIPLTMGNPFTIPEGMRVMTNNCEWSWQ